MLRRIFKWAAIALAVGVAALLVAALVPVRTTTILLEPRDSTQYWTMSGGYRIAYSRIAAARDHSVDAGAIGSMSVGLASENPAPVIYLHGGPGGYIHSSTIATVGRLAQLGRDVYLYDQSGTGLSDRRRPKATTVDAHVADLTEIVEDHLGGGPVAVIGHSYGGMLAALFAADRPELVDRVILSSPGALHPALFDDDGRWVNDRRYPVPDSLRFIDVAQTMAHDTELRRLPVRAVASIALAFAFDVKLASDRELDTALSRMASGFLHNMVCDAANVRPDEGGAGAYSRTSANYYPDGFVDRRPKMREAGVRVMVLQGQCDYIPYAAAYEYVDLFPNATYRFIEEAGHVIWWDRPDEYVRLMGEFLAQPGGRR